MNEVFQNNNGDFAIFCNRLKYDNYYRNNFTEQGVLTLHKCSGKPICYFGFYIDGYVSVNSKSVLEIIVKIKESI